MPRAKIENRATGSEYAAKSTRRLIEAGGRRIEVKLSPEGASALGELEAREQRSVKAIVEELLIKAAKP